MSSPRVSICIPAYEQVDCLVRTLDSIALQDFRDFEIVVTDDSSDDRVERLLDDYDFGGRLRYFRNAERLGSPANWNQAIGRATGEYIKILHHDDWLARSDSLGRFVAALDGDPQADFAFSGTRIVDARDGSERYHFASDDDVERLRSDPTTLFFGNFVGSPSATCYRAAAVRAFDESLRWLVDVDHYIRVLTANARFVYADEALVATLEATPHRVTAACLQDPAIDVAEHLALFAKLARRGQVTDAAPFRSHLRRRIEGAGALAPDDLRAAGYAGPLTPEILRQMRRQRIVDALFAAPLRFTRRMAGHLRRSASAPVVDDDRSGISR